VRGSVTFVEFEKTTPWHEDGLERLEIELADLEFKEVRINPLSWETTRPEHVCPGQHCGAAEDQDCLRIDGYAFSYTLSE
jgi:hypothetical protein